MTKTKRVYFTENHIKYGQDFQRKVGLPTYWFFTVNSDREDEVCLEASGYGAKPYGNGRVTIKKSELENNPAVHWVE